ncbi:helix-turn-helix domain-containing protein [Streptococcus merionis]|uniref:helix-turn-helix domain-containing protein n=1 Tax=Streptococcus merionis TaxID=400065 RepID=UPI0035172FBE
MQLGDLIKQERQKQGNTQESLAEMLGVSRQTIINWEKGKTLPDSQSLVRLAKEYHLSFDELLGLQVATKRQHIWKNYAILLATLALGSLVNIGNNAFIPLVLFVLLLIFLIKELRRTK